MRCNVSIITSLYDNQRIFKDLWKTVTDENPERFINKHGQISFELKEELYEILDKIYKLEPSIATSSDFMFKYLSLNYELHKNKPEIKIHEELEYFFSMIEDDKLVNFNAFKSFYNHYTNVFEDGEIKLLLAKNILNIDNIGELLNVWIPKILASYKLNNGKLIVLKPKLAYCDKSILLDKAKRKIDINDIANLKKYSMACPNESCENGYMTEKNGYLECNKCLTHYCIKCRKTLEKDHECKQEDVESIEFIKENSRECPCCGTIIQKSRGCNHMFCTICHTGFCYRTGRILRDSEQTNTLFTEWKQQQEQKGVTHNDKLTINQLILHAQDIGRSYHILTFYERSIVKLSRLYKQYESKKLDMLQVFCDNQENILNAYENPSEIINLFHHINLANMKFKFIIYMFSEFINSDGKGDYTLE
jgi:hypothetical protein